MLSVCTSYFHISCVTHLETVLCFLVKKFMHNVLVNKLVIVNEMKVNLSTCERLKRPDDPVLYLAFHPHVPCWLLQEPLHMAANLSTVQKYTFEFLINSLESNFRVKEY